MKLPQTPREIITWFLHLALGAVFIYSGVLKLWGLGPITFTDDIRSFHLLQDPWVAWVAMSLPWLEILSGLAVIFGPCRRGGLLIICGSLLVFLVAIGQAMARGIDISCGCFGHSDRASNAWELFTRDVILLGVGIYLLWITRAGRSVSPLAE
jgi:putative oxidoreductase